MPRKSPKSTRKKCNQYSEETILDVYGKDYPANLGKLLKPRWRMRDFLRKGYYEEDPDASLLRMVRKNRKDQCVTRPLYSSSSSSPSMAYVKDISPRHSSSSSSSSTVYIKDIEGLDPKRLYRISKGPVGCRDLKKFQRIKSRATSAECHAIIFGSGLAAGALVSAHHRPARSNSTNELKAILAKILSEKANGSSSSIRKTIKVEG